MKALKSIPKGQIGSFGIEKSTFELLFNTSDLPFSCFDLPICLFGLSIGTFERDFSRFEKEKSTFDLPFSSPEALKGISELIFYGLHIETAPAAKQKHTLQSETSAVFSESRA